MMVSAGGSVGFAVLAAGVGLGGLSSPLTGQAEPLHSLSLVTPRVRP